MALFLDVSSDDSLARISAIKQMLEEEYNDLDNSCEVIFSGCEGESITALKEFYEKIKKEYESSIEFFEKVHDSLEKSIEEIRAKDAETALNISMIKRQ